MAVDKFANTNCCMMVISAKSLRLLLSVLLIPFMSSCKVMEQEIASANEPLTKMTIEVGTGTKTSLAVTNVLWSKGDKITVFDGTGNRCFSSVSDNGPIASFNGFAAESDSYDLLYPYNPSAVIESGKILTEVPVKQHAARNSFGPDANVSVGRYDGHDATMMYNACALMKFSIKSGLDNVTSVCFTTRSAEKISGPAEISLINGEVATELQDGAYDYVELYSSQAFTDGDYYIVIAPGVISSFRVVFTSSNGNSSEVEVDGPFEFETNRITNVGTFEVDLRTDFIEEPDDMASDPVSAYISQGIDFSTLASAGHPRLFLNEDEMQALRNRVMVSSETEDLFYKIHSVLMNNAVYYLDINTPPEYKLVNKKLLEQARTALMRIFHFSYAYRMTGESAYLDAVREDLSIVCKFQDWNADQHFLDCSELALAVAVAYDWLYYDLSLEERTSARNALKSFMLTPFSEYTPTTKNNWNQVCNGGAIAAALAIYEKDKQISASTIDKAIQSNLSAVDYMYNPDGNGIEGYGYWEYAATYQAVIINALESVFNTSCGIAENQGFQRTPSWKLFMDGVTGPFNFSDNCSESQGVTPVMFWMGARYAKPEYLVVEKYVMAKKNMERIGHRCMPLVICGMQKYGYVDSDASFPSQKVWSSSDGKSPILLARTSWNFDNSDMYLGFKGSGGYNNHSHMDAGSFVFDASGNRWASDIPMGNYNDYSGNDQLFNMGQASTRWDILCQNNYFHNTLSFTKSSILSFSSKLHTTDQILGEAGAVLSVYDSDEEGYGAKMDLTTYYSEQASKVHRTVKIKDGSLYVIDEITSKKWSSAPFEWRMITKASVETGTDYITLTQGGETMYLKATVTEGSATGFAYGYEETITRPSGWTERSWDSAQNYSKYKVVKYSAEVPANKTTVFTTILTPTRP